MVNVLVWGTAEQGPCAYFRGHLYDEPLRELGVNMRHISKVGFTTIKKDIPPHTTLRDALDQGWIAAETEDFDWADVVMFRRYYDTSIKCTLPPEECQFLSPDPVIAAAHVHRTKRQDDITRVIWPWFRDHWTKGMVYETDDNHFTIKPWNGYYGAVQNELDLVTEMAQRADIQTVATPMLAKTYGRLNANTRVIRNAIDPSLYSPSDPMPNVDKSKPRLLYYGATVRLRDYLGYPDDRHKWKGGYCGAAVRAYQKELRSVFIGTNPGTEQTMAEHFNEQYNYIEGIAAFSRAIVDSQPDIGVAPLHDDDNFDINKSELHWLEYSLAGAATIGTRFMGGGPYDVIRNGVDGILARGSQEWNDAVKSLVRNPNKRIDMAAAAKERVLAEYDYRDRAKEWAEVFHWAAEHPNYQGRAA